MHRLIILAALLLNMDGCWFTPQPDTVEQVEERLPYPDSLETCEAAGGHWDYGGLRHQQLCFMPQPDAGQACSKASDCNGVCLADSKTCSPEHPIFGCYSYLREDGSESMICVD